MSRLQDVYPRRVKFPCALREEDVFSASLMNEDINEVHVIQCIIYTCTLLLSYWWSVLVQILPPYYSRVTVYFIPVSVYLFTLYIKCIDISSFGLSASLCSPAYLLCNLILRSKQIATQFSWNIFPSPPHSSSMCL